MPVLTTAACVTSVTCPLPTFPSAAAVCACGFAYGGVNDVYIIPCTEILSATNVMDLEWWETLIDDGKLYQMGSGIGNVSKKATKTEKLSSCGIETPISSTWALKYTQKCFDKSSADSTRERINNLITKSKYWLVVARLCDGDETILPIGRYTATDFDWLHPDAVQDLQNVMIEFGWEEFPLPKLYSVAGLATILPKAA